MEIQHNDKEILKNNKLFKSDMSDEEYAAMADCVKSKGQDAELPLLDVKPLNPKLGWAPGNLEVKLGGEAINFVRSLDISFDAESSLTIATIKIPVKLTM